MRFSLSLSLTLNSFNHENIEDANAATAERIGYSSLNQQTLI